MGYLLGLIVAAFAVGWLSERRRWDRRSPSAARLALAGVALMYVPGLIWLEVTALLMRQTHSPSHVLPSIPMLTSPCRFWPSAYRVRGRPSTAVERQRRKRR